MFVSVSHIELQEEIQALINKACPENASKDASKAKEAPKKQNKTKASSKAIPDLPEPVEPDDMFRIEKNFDVQLSTVNLFIEQDSFFNVPLHLDVNYQKIHQENFMQEKGKTMLGAIFEKRGDTFQNGPIHLLFYEKVMEDIALDMNAPELQSMSYCRLKSNSGLNLPNLAFELELQLVLRGVTTQFVSKDQYKQLQFILGMEPNSSTGIQQTYKEILELFNDFNTNSPEGFQDMLHAFEFPFIYNKKKSIAQNRCDFKDFFPTLLTSDVLLLKDLTGVKLLAGCFKVICWVKSYHWNTIS